MKRFLNLHNAFAATMLAAFAFYLVLPGAVVPAGKDARTTSDEVVDLRAAFGAPVGAADVTLTGSAPFYLLDVATGSAKKVILPPAYKVTIAHTGLHSDGTSSGASDYVVLMLQTATMAANTTAGVKSLIFPNGFATVRGYDIGAGGTDGDYEIQLQAVTGSAKIQFVLVPMEKGK